MKKLFLFSLALSFVMYSCKKKEEAPGPAPAPKVVNKVTIDLVQTGDTISTYTTVKYGLFTINLAAFEQNNTSITGKVLDVQLLALDASGTFKKDNTPFTSGSLKTDTTYSFSFYPTLTKGRQRYAVKITTAEGKVFADTSSFYVKTYEPISFNLTTSPKVFNAQTATSSFQFNLAISSSDLSNSIKYYLAASITPTPTSGTVSFKDITNNPIYSGQLIRTGSGNYAVNVNLTNHSTGTYKIPLRVSDQNGDFKLDTITYVVN